MGDTAITTYFTTFSYDDEDNKAYYYDSYKTIRRKAFVLSATELGEYASTPDVPHEGSSLSNIDSLYYTILNGKFAWTRTRLDYKLSNAYDDWGLDYTISGTPYRNIVFCARGTSYGISSEVQIVTEKEYVIPAFTFPNDVEVDANGRIML